jgi:hypothetical protein
MLDSVKRTVTDNFRRNAQIPATISDADLWQAIEDNDIMTFNPEIKLNVLRSVLDLPEIPGLVDH